MKIWQPHISGLIFFNLPRQAAIAASLFGKARPKVFVPSPRANNMNRSTQVKKAYLVSRIFLHSNMILFKNILSKLNYKFICATYNDFLKHSRNVFKRFVYWGERPPGQKGRQCSKAAKPLPSFFRRKGTFV